MLAGDGDIHIGKHNSHTISFGQVQIKAKKGWIKTFIYPFADITEVEEIDAEAYRTGTATAGWGLVGLAVAGPFGAVLGGIFGGKTDKVIAAVKFKDGRKFLGEFNRNPYRKMTAHLRTAQAMETFGKSRSFHHTTGLD